MEPPLNIDLNIPPLNIDLNIPFNPCDHDYNINQLPDLNSAANVEDTSLSRDDSNLNYTMKLKVMK